MSINESARRWRVHEHNACWRVYLFALLCNRGQPAGLCVAPHPDDEILGTGGLLAKLSDLGRNVLIIAGTVVGSAGTLLTQLMAKAMNRSLGNVLFSNFGETSLAGSGSVRRVRCAPSDDARSAPPRVAAAATAGWSPDAGDAGARGLPAKRQ